MVAALGEGRVWLNGTPAAAALPTPGDDLAPVARGTPSSTLAPFVVNLPDGWDTWPLGRDQVWLIPAAAQGIQVIAGTIGTLPLARRRGREVLDLGTFLTQPDPVEPRVSTVTRLVEDLVLFPEAYLVVIDRDADGFPRHARYVPHELVEPSDPPLDPNEAFKPPRRYRVGIGPGIDVPARDVIRFPSHWPGLLTVGARTLRTAMLLESAAQRFAQMDVPAGTLKNRGADLPPDKVDELLSRWEASRRSHGVGYTNAMVDFVVTQFDAAQMQLVDARRWSTAEIARLLNLPSRYLNAETESSMTYSNVESARRDLVDLSLRPYLAVTEQRVSLDDACPHGQHVTWELDAFYRGDLSARAAYYTAALNPGAPWMVVDEVRAAEGMPPMGGSADAAPPAP